MKTAINWRIFFLLLFLSILSVFAVFPYVLSLQGETIKQVGQPIQVIFLLQLIQSIILFSFCIFFGLSLAKKIHFRIPFPNLFILPSIFSGIGVAFTIFMTDRLFTLQGALISTSNSPAPIWQKLLAALYGGITEEILMRLFLMSFFIWVIMKITKQTKPSQITIVISILLAAIIFGLGHLPITASLTKLTPLIITRAIILNGIGGVVFGLLYWRKGLESAMIAHFTTDIFLLTVLPLLF